MFTTLLTLCLILKSYRKINYVNNFKTTFKKLKFYIQIFFNKNILKFSSGAKEEKNSVALVSFSSETTIFFGFVMVPI